MSSNHLGILYIVATPLGHLQDITWRAIDVLKHVDWIAAEDTRHSAALLQHYAIATPRLSLHDHNEREQALKLIERLKQGASIALISDAGTPLISDPGYHLVRAVRAAGIKVVPIPGACAAITALCAGGLPTDRFVFEGFLPAKSKGRLDRLQLMANESRTMIFYEAPHRILDLLADMQTVWGHERQVVIARELTKMFETIHSGSLLDVFDWVKNDANQQRGEIVVLVEGLQQLKETIPYQTWLTVLFAENLPLKQVVDIVVKITGEKKNKIYEAALLIKKLGST